MESEYMTCEKEELMARLYVGIADADGAKELDEMDVPYKTVGGLALVPRFLFGDEHEDGSAESALVTRDMMAALGLDEDGLMGACMENSYALCSPRLERVEGDGNRKDAEGIVIPSTYVMTNKFGGYGAAAAFYGKRLIGGIAGKTGRSFIILPAGKEEMFLVHVESERQAAEIAKAYVDAKEEIGGWLEKPLESSPLIYDRERNEIRPMGAEPGIQAIPNAGAQAPGFAR